MQFSYPIGIIFDYPSSHIIVAEFGNKRIQNWLKQLTY